MLNHAEAMGKAHKQMAMNRLYDTIILFPDIAQVIEVNNNMGNFTVSEKGKDVGIGQAKNLVVKWVDGNPKAVAISKEIQDALDIVMKPLIFTSIESVAYKATRAFSLGTTGYWPSFATGNIQVDSATAVVNTNHRYIPVISQLKLLIDMLMGDPVTAGFAREYFDLAGHETMLNINSASGDELLSKIKNEAEGLEKVGKMVSSGIDIGLAVLSLPANSSEIATRIVEYINSRKAGNDIFTALEEAGQLTTPYHHSGTAFLQSGRVLLGSIPYLKAITQSSAQFGKTLGTKRGRRRFAVVMGVITGAYVASMLMAQNDDDARRAYANLDPKELARYVFFYK